MAEDKWVADPAKECNQTTECDHNIRGAAGRETVRTAPAHAGIALIQQLDTRVTNLELQNRSDNERAKDELNLWREKAMGLTPTVVTSTSTK